MKRTENNPDVSNDKYLSKENIENEEETLREKQIWIFKLNTTKLLHEWNKYVFLASVADESIRLKT